MRAIRYFLLLAIVLLTIKCNSQVKEYLINDILIPDLKGQVRSFTEFIISSKDTLRVMHVSYSKAGTRDTQYIRSSHLEMGFANDSICYKTKGKEIYSVDCKTDKKKDTKISIGDNGLIIEMDIKYPDQEISLIPEYNVVRRLTGINTARSKNNTFQFFATLSYTFNNSGSIKESEAQGGDQPQGKTKYFYDNKNLLIRTVRSGFDGNKSFTIEFNAHDEKGNWTSSSYQNGIMVNREIQYY